MLTFWFWVAAGAANADVPMGEGVALRVRLPPMTFNAPFGIDSPDDRRDIPDSDESDELVSESDGDSGDSEFEDLDDAE
ncbi:MAG: hypothetical protein WA268_27475 [Xanthobacteraceae bacterium]